MGLFSKKTDDYSKQVNQELYKRNVELAFHNKMLNLLRSLYRITLSNLGAREVAEQMVGEIESSLAARCVQIRILNKDKTVLGSLACSCAVDDKGHDHRLCNIAIKHDTSSIAGHILESRQQMAIRSLGELWGEADSEQYKTLQKNLGIVELVVYPLVLGEEMQGLLLFGFDRSVTDLSTYEQETIDNVARLVSIAIDKSMLYDRLRELNIQLEKQNIQLKELDQQKTDFLSIASHQLRTPLTVLNGYIELIKDGAYGKVQKETKEVLDNMDQSNGHLIKLVEEFLDISRLDQGRTKFDFSEKDLGELIDGVVKEQSLRAKQKNIKMHWKKPTKHVLVTMDEEKIRHVIYNFVDNALKYSEKGAITVKLDAEDGGLSVRVIDQGFGFGKLDEANFFQKFYRGENVKGTEVNGTGLGLYVCRKFIEGHKGKIWAHSEGLGKGAEFGFWVPNT